MSIEETDQAPAAPAPAEPASVAKAAPAEPASVAPSKPPAPLGRNGRPVFSRHYAAPALLLALCLVLGEGCAFLKKVEDALPPVQLCVTYKGRQFCAQKVNGAWKFDADLTADEQTEIVNSIEGGR